MFLLMVPEAVLCSAVDFAFFEHVQLNDQALIVTEMQQHNV